MLILFYLILSGGIIKMSRAAVKKYAIFTILIILIVSIGILAIDLKPAFADDYVKQDELHIIHITDLHYYPLRYCTTTYEKDYKKALQKGFKIVEPSATFEHLLGLIYEQAPDYLIVSGDNTYDGERAAHIDVANALRDLQNRIRADYNKPDFQVFTVFGNHDINNGEAYRFLADGTRVYTSSVGRKDLSIIYSSLGFPDITNEQALDFYREEELTTTLLPYQTEGSAFVNSTTAANLTLAWQYIENGFQEQDDYDKGDLSYIALNDNDYFFLGADVPLSCAEDGHVLGGRLFDSTVDFIEAHKQNIAGKTGVALLHHNALPHFREEYNYLTGFILENYALATDYLADIGINYVFTGHFHANDIMGHTSFNLNRILDIETASLFSTGGGYRNAFIERGLKGDIPTQKFRVKSHVIREIDYSNIINEGYLPMQHLIAMGETHFFNNGVCSDMSVYSGVKQFSTVVDAYTLDYLDIDKILELLDGVKDMLPVAFSGIAPLLDKIVINLISQIEEIGLQDYEYQGDYPAFQNGQNKLFAYLKDMVDKLVDMQVSSDGTNLYDFFVSCFLMHLESTDVSSFEELPENIQEALTNLRAGKPIKELMDLLINNDDSLFNMLTTVLESEIDLTQGLTSSELAALKLATRLLGNPDPTKIDLGVLIDKATKLFGFDIDLGGLTLMDFVQGAIKEYITDSLYSGLGNIAADIVESFAVDPFYEGPLEELNLVTFEKGDEFTFTGEALACNASIENGKLPSMLAVNFGADPKTTKNFVYFTDPRVEDTQIAYYPYDGKPFDISKAKVVSGDTQIYAMRRPLIDIGLLAITKTTIEKARHTINLEGLSHNTTYYYKVGSVDKGFLSPAYTFKTAPADNSAFEALIIADLQGYTAAEYRQVNHILGNIDSVFKLGYDFVLDMGDSVDSSNNIKQYEYYLDIPQAIWGNTTLVCATGNHETATFEKTDDYTPSSPDVVTSAYNYMVAHHNFSYPTQNTSTGVYYSFDYSGVHFTVLDTNDIVKDKLGQAQFDWLVQDLQTTDKAHKVVITHKGPYTRGSHSYNADVMGLREQLTPIFANFEVALVLQGHDHTYTESYYLDAEGNPVNLPATGKKKIGGEGTLYINVGTLGNKFYEYKDNPNVPIAYGKGLQTPTFGILYYDGVDLYYQGYEYDLATDTIKELNPYTALANILTAGAIIVAVLAVGVFVTVREIKIRKASK